MVRRLLTSPRSRRGWLALARVGLVLVLAVGLLWLSVRTFDGCFGRIPERPGRAPVLSDVVVVLAGLALVRCREALTAR